MKNARRSTLRDHNLPERRPDGHHFALGRCVELNPDDRMPFTKKWKWQPKARLALGAVASNHFTFWSALTSAGGAQKNGICDRIDNVRSDYEPGRRSILSVRYFDIAAGFSRKRIALRCADLNSTLITVGITDKQKPF